jgi:hypothetical protein
MSSGLVKYFTLIHYPSHLHSLCRVSSSALDRNHTDANPDHLKRFITNMSDPDPAKRYRSDRIHIQNAGIFIYLIALSDPDFCSFAVSYICCLVRLHLWLFPIVVLHVP